MYRIPIPSHGGRVLQLCAGSERLFEESPATGESIVTCFLAAPSMRADLPATGKGLVCAADFRKELPFADHAFDLVFMHGSLDLLVDRHPELGSADAMTGLAARIRRVLTPGGAFTGSVSNRTSKRRWRYLIRGNPNLRRTTAPFSILSCRKFLARSGFEDIEIFNVLPTADSPMRLINTARDLSRIGFRRELQAIQPSLAWPSYIARRLMVELTLNRFFEESIFFWAYKR